LLPASSFREKFVAPQICDFFNKICHFRTLAPQQTHAEKAVACVIGCGRAHPDRPGMPPPPIEVAIKAFGVTEPQRQKRLAAQSME